MAKKINYLANKELVKQIHNAKKTYNWYADERFSDFDIAVDSIEEVTRERLESELEKLQAINRRSVEDRGQYDNYAIEDLVVRVKTDEHVPRAACGTKRITLPFPPFKHVIYENGVVHVVGISHWKDDQFSVEHGRVTPALGRAYKLMVDKIATKGNFSGYSFIEDMKSEALVNLCKAGLMFDETFIPANGQLNPFSYWTSCVHNAFIRVIKKEKQVQKLRDDLLEQNGLAASTTRQVENQLKS